MLPATIPLAVPLPSCKTPALTVVVPLKLLLAARTSVPVPSLVRPPILELARALAKVTVWPLVLREMGPLLLAMPPEQSSVLLPVNCSVPPPKVMAPPPARAAEPANVSTPPLRLVTPP